VSVSQIYLFLSWIEDLGKGITMNIVKKWSFNSVTNCDWKISYKILVTYVNENKLFKVILCGMQARGLKHEYSACGW